MIARPSNVFFFLFVLVHDTVPVVEARQYVQWIVDERCPDEGDRRGLYEEMHEDIIDGGNDKIEQAMAHSIMSDSVSPISEEAHLRGRDSRQGEADDNNIREQTHNNNDASRALQQSGAANPMTFNLKLHWKYGYCWQREMIERKWCLQCPGSTCSSGDFLWTNECNQFDPLQRFEWVQLGTDPTRQNKNQGLVKVAGRDLCLHQLGPGTFRLLPCNEYHVDQKFVGFDRNKPFELNPARLNHIDDCLTQDHHPKPYEELKSQPCYVARRDRTNYWEIYKPSGSGYKPSPGSSTRFPACSPNLPCNACQGDCNRDADCRGTLRCFQRGYAAAQSVPGCSGVSLAQYVDYCYDPQS